MNFTTLLVSVWLFICIKITSFECYNATRFLRMIVYMHQNNIIWMLQRNSFLYDCWYTSKLHHLNVTTQLVSEWLFIYIKMTSFECYNATRFCMIVYMHQNNIIWMLQTQLVSVWLFIYIKITSFECYNATRFCMIVYIHQNDIIWMLQCNSVWLFIYIKMTSFESYNATRFCMIVDIRQNNIIWMLQCNSFLYDCLYTSKWHHLNVTMQLVSVWLFVYVKITSFECYNTTRFCMIVDIRQNNIIWMLQLNSFLYDCLYTSKWHHLNAKMQLVSVWLFIYIKITSFECYNATRFCMIVYIHQNAIIWMLQCNSFLYDCLYTSK